MENYNKKLTITTKLEYDPLREYTRQGTCLMKCPCGECTLEVVIVNDLQKVVQVIDIKGTMCGESNDYSLTYSPGLAIPGVGDDVAD